MELKFSDFVITLLLYLVRITRCEHIPSCNASALEPCPGEHIACDEESRSCVCEAGRSWDGEECASPDEPTYGHGSTVVIAVVFTLVLLTSALVLIFRKYKVLDYIRQKINERRNNDIMYEDVMIGQDDPPLSP